RHALEPAEVQRCGGGGRAHTSGGRYERGLVALWARARVRAEERFIHPNHACGGAKVMPLQVVGRPGSVPAGATDNGNGTFTMSDGTVAKINNVGRFEVVAGPGAPASGSGGQ